jgi:hypothetical protein
MNGFERYTKKTRRQVFLEEMEQVVPWRELCSLTNGTALSQAGEWAPAGGSGADAADLFSAAVVLPVGPGRGRGPVYDSPVMRQFVGIDLGHEPAPDETTVCKSRHLLENIDLGKRFWARSICTCKPGECASPPARSWTQPSCTHPRQGCCPTCCTEKETRVWSDQAYRGQTASRAHQWSVIRVPRVASISGC